MDQDIIHYTNISDLLYDLGEAGPRHPLIALVDYDQATVRNIKMGAKITLDFYKISFKDSFFGQVKYGQGYYDFKAGGLAFLKPKQVVIAPENEDSYQGKVIYFHPDFIRHHQLGKTIHQYGFFSYDVAEALHLSDHEKTIISNLFKSIERELQNNIDQFSQDVLVSSLELLLNYSNRFYNRQFITRKVINNETIASLDQLLVEYYNGNKALQSGLPSVQEISHKLGVSQRYLSDMLRQLTGINTQQYIQNKIIEHSKDLLGSTSLSVSEIAYQLGFEHPQSFSKLFKAKTELTPLQFRQSFDNQ
ncbi:helix-turn-helix domain-containing protein [Fulvivirga ligni]|uniref:helix-turn-helix domain-containing protein n=1 Tax=Fulvivirga ligni TaxID=2904246 RepID=UPI001F19FCBD|nr:helix-turn-helix domain-containing protein [Fulvivirga ligni]UII20752.1 AraC family transcriptional regulator [Fulvivirga ligni]